LDYMSPEVRAGKAADARSDIYAVGVLAYLFLTGQKPLGRAKAPSVLAKGISTKWDDWIDKCLEMNPADRFASAGEALEALETVPLGGDSVPPVTPPELSKKAEVPQVALVRSGAASSSEPPSKPQVAAKEIKAVKETRAVKKHRSALLLVLLGLALVTAAALTGLIIGGHIKPASMWKDIASIFTSSNSSSPSPSTKTPPPDFAPSKPEPTSSSRSQASVDKPAASTPEPEKPAVIKFASMQVDSVPSGALVSVDGGQAQRTPTTFERLDPGTHRLRFEMEGYDTAQQTVKLKAGDQAHIAPVSLTRQTGSLALGGSPSDLSWVIVSAPADSERSGSAGSGVQTFSDLPTGLYEFEFSLDGFPSKRLSVKIEAGKQAALDCAFPGGPLLISSNVDAATVKDYTGRVLGRTPFRIPHLAPGSYAYRISADGYSNADVQGEMIDGGSLSLNAELTKISKPIPGQVALISLPGGESMAMEWIKYGSFVMGSSKSEGGRESDEDAHTVGIGRAFWMGRTEVTQAQWKAVMGSAPSGFSASGPDAPVESVSWNDAQQFCAKLSQIAREAGTLPEGYEFRLPTEAQWEYACRAGTTGAYAGPMRDMAWSAVNSGRSTHKVAQKLPNAWGLFDMHGNVAEWCLDWYAPYSGDSLISDGPRDGTFKVVRGGSWQQGMIKCRSAARNRFLPTDRWNYIGFRPVLVWSW